MLRLDSFPPQKYLLLEYVEQHLLLFAPFHLFASGYRRGFQNSTWSEKGRQ